MSDELAEPLSWNQPAIASMLQIVFAGQLPEPPVPLKLTKCGLPGALSWIVKVPLLLPLCVGVKVTLTVQLVLVLRLKGGAGHGFDSPLMFQPKSPLTLKLLTVTGCVPVLVKVRICGLLVWPTGSDPKLMLLGETLSAGPPTT